MIQIFEKNELDPSEILRRDNAATGVESAVAEIIQNVRSRGDAALMEYCEKFDGAAPQYLEVSREEIDAACTALEPEFLAVLEEAAANIRDFHSRQRRESLVVTREGGRVLGQKIMPLARAGVYVPGGTACYPSTVLMNCIPAKIAGVPEVCVCTPAKNGEINPAILAAAKIAGADRVFRVGGAQAVAAMAYGTESIPRVDKITGPGNVFVAEAKRQVYGQVDIDMIAGPSEILVVADEHTDPAWCAADMLSQAEHDKNAAAVLVTTSRELAIAVRQQLEIQLADLPRQEIARASIDNRGRIIIAGSIDEAIELANAIAPEHLELCLDEPFDWLDKVRCAGSVFLGRNCPEALGDYLAGPNHTLPTGGSARFSSPLSVDDFVKKTQFIYYSPAALDAVSGQIQLFAAREGLEGHGRSVKIRGEAKK
ncbi:MAG: histidinol dehydrogenase [Candidatus Heteroscillospira sp.]|jgi:histidinol dehydrogenase